MTTDATTGYTPYAGATVLETGLDAKLNINTSSLYDNATGTGPGSIAYDESQQTSTNEIRKDITDYVRMRLGDGIVDVELEKEHYEMAINQALIKYRQRASNSQEESYCSLQLLPETQEYILPKEIMEVRAIFRRGIGSVTGTTASQFEPFASGYLNTYMLTAGRVGGLVNYELFVDYQKLAMTMFGGYINHTFNKVTRKLTLVRKIPFAGPNLNNNDMESVILWCWNYKPDSMILNDVQAFPWIQEYAYSFSKMLLGQAYSKFSTIAGPGGGTSLNGAGMVQESQAEMTQLIEDLKTYVDGSQPLTWITG
jgi:hypothetical protein